MLCSVSVLGDDLQASRLQITTKLLEQLSTGEAQSGRETPPGPSEDEPATCALPMPTPMTTSFWRGPPYMTAGSATPCIRTLSVYVCALFWMQSNTGLVLSLHRPSSPSDDGLEARLAKDTQLQHALAVSQRVGRLLLKAEAGELALVDQLAQELLAGRDRRAARSHSRGICRQRGTALPASAPAGALGPALHAS